MGLTDKQILGAFSRMVKHKPKAMEWIDKSFLSVEMQEAYVEVLGNRYGRLKL